MKTLSEKTAIVTKAVENADFGGYHNAGAYCALAELRNCNGSEQALKLAVEGLRARADSTSRSGMRDSEAMYRSAIGYLTA